MAAGTPRLSQAARVLAAAQVRAAAGTAWQSAQDLSRSPLIQVSRPVFLEGLRYALKVGWVERESGRYRRT